jgi:hypothetical protein
MSNVSMWSKGIHVKKNDCKKNSYNYNINNDGSFLEVLLFLFLFCQRVGMAPLTLKQKKPAPPHPPQKKNPQKLPTLEKRGYVIHTIFHDQFPWPISKSEDGNLANW